MWLENEIIFIVWPNYELWISFICEAISYMSSKTNKKTIKIMQPYLMHNESVFNS